MIIYLTLISSLLMATLAIGQSGQAPSLGLSDLLSEAKSSQLAWQEAQTRRQKAEENVVTQRSKFLPDLSLRSSLSKNWQTSERKQESLGSEAAVVSEWSL